MINAWIPPSGMDSVDGYIWLPRMLAKARRAREFPLEGYLSLSTSPIDRFAMWQWRINAALINEWLDVGMSDEDIALRIAVEANHKNIVQRQSFSRTLRAVFGLSLWGMEADEGRLQPGLATSVLKAINEAIYRVVLVIHRVLGVK